MFSADLLEIEHAATAFGITTEALLTRLDGGAVPEAVQHDGSWSVPTEALAAIAAREGWPLDLTTPRGDATAVPHQLDRYTNDTMAAHAAVVLAKTQATAARAGAKDLTARLERAEEELGTERSERERAANVLAETRKQQAILERDRAVAEARADEVRRQIDQERVERALLTSRIASLEADREEALSSMGWWSRRRYRQRRTGSRPRSPQAVATAPQTPTLRPAEAPTATRPTSPPPRVAPATSGGVFGDPNG